MAAFVAVVTTGIEPSLKVVVDREVVDGGGHMATKGSEVAAFVAVRDR